MPRPKNERELICADCPLTTCNENSIWCAYSWLMRPNDVQLSALRRYEKKRIKASKKARRQAYLAQYYADNRIRKIMAAKVRQWQRKGKMGPPGPVRESEVSA